MSFRLPVNINRHTDVTFHDYSICIQQNKELVQWSFTGSSARFFFHKSYDAIFVYYLSFFIIWEMICNTFDKKATKIRGRANYVFYWTHQILVVYDIGVSQYSRHHFFLLFLILLVREKLMHAEIGILQYMLNTEYLKAFFKTNSEEFLEGAYAWFTLYG